MKTKIAGIVSAVLVAALPLAAAMVDGERVERVVVAEVTGEGAGAAAEGEAKQFVRVVVKDENGEEVVLEDVVGAPHRQVFRIEGKPGAEGERVRVFHAGPEGFRSFGPIEGKGFLGVHLVELTPELRTHFGAGDAGLLVGSVEAGSPAELAGLRVGDVLTRVGGEAVTGNWDVLRKVRPLTAGQGVALEVVRDGRVETLSATVVEREQPQLDAHALLRRLDEDGNVKVFQVDPQELRERMGEVTEFFASPEWREKVKTLTVTGEGLAERVDALELEIERLEKELEEERRQP